MEANGRQSFVVHVVPMSAFEMRVAQDYMSSPSTRIGQYFPQDPGFGYLVDKEAGVYFMPAAIEEYGECDFVEAYHDIRAYERGDWWYERVFAVLRYTYVDENGCVVTLHAESPGKGGVDSRTNDLFVKEVYEAERRSLIKALYHAGIVVEGGLYENPDWDSPDSTAYLDID